MKNAAFLVLAFLLLAGSAQAEAPRVVPASRAELQFSYAPIVKSAAPAVVNIYTRKLVRERVLSPLFDDPLFQQFFGGRLPSGMTRQRLENALGSGVIVSPEGLVVTSNHVIAGAEEIRVVLADRREFDAALVTADTKADLAVLRLQGKGEKFPFLPLKDSDEAEVGNIVLAIGNPFGVGQTVTSGIVSALARTNLDINDLNYFIQTDAAINPGNSGGALVAMDGRLLGINTAIYSKSGGNMGLGFAVPSNMVRAVLGGVQADGKKSARPWTGIEAQEVTADLAASMGLARPVGVLVKGLHRAAPALKAGLKIGDVITRLGGKEVNDPAAFAYRIATMAAGGEAEAEILRLGKPMTLHIPLIAAPEVPPRETTLLKGSTPLSGAKIANFSPALGEETGLHEEGKVVILSIASGTPAARLGLEEGDGILQINGHEISSVADAREALESGARSWRLTLRRDGEVVTLMVGGR